MNESDINGYAPPLDDTALMIEVVEILSSDAFAVTFENSTSYRKFIVNHIRNTQLARTQLATKTEGQQ